MRRTVYPARPSRAGPGPRSCPSCSPPALAPSVCLSMLQNPSEVLVHHSNLPCACLQLHLPLEIETCTFLPGKDPTSPSPAPPHVYDADAGPTWCLGIIMVRNTVQCLPLKMRQAMSWRGACAGSPSASRTSSMAASLDGEDGSPSKAAISLDAAGLGSPDCLLVGTNWSIPAHRWDTLRCDIIKSKPTSFQSQ